MDISGGVAHDAGIGAVLQPDMSNRRNMPSAPPESTGNAVSDYANVGDADFQSKEIKKANYHTAEVGVYPCVQ